MKLFQIPILLFDLLLFASCKQEYYPKIKPGEQSVLVVEGILNNGAGPTTIHLSRTLNLNDSVALRPESGATITVESESGAVFPLFENTPGTYVAAQLDLPAIEKYRLRIGVSNGKTYASDFMAPQANPPIDSINWTRKEDGVSVFVNTHNAENNTRYYRWEFEETWMTRATYFANYKMEGSRPVRRQLPEEQVYYCWKTFSSSELFLGSSAQLAQDVIAQKKLIFIPAATDKLAERYSVLVRQFALTKEAYNFYQLLKKNTESLGSIFDAQPSEITGNIRSLSDGSEPVIGFVTIAPGQEKRIFITRDEVPDWGYRLYCLDRITVPNNPDSIVKYLMGDYYPYDAMELGGRVVEYYGVRPECAVCTLRGGTTQKPDFW